MKNGIISIFIYGIIWDNIGYYRIIYRLKENISHQ